jgi:hypothetical protein
VAGFCWLAIPRTDLSVVRIPREFGKAAGDDWVVGRRGDRSATDVDAAAPLSLRLERGEDGRGTEETVRVREV